MPITSQVKGYPFEVMIDEKEIQGAILCDQMRSLDWKCRKAKFVMQISRFILNDALAKFQILISGYAADHH